MEEILNFLRLVRVNNNREWFHANKDLYLAAKDKFESLAKEILAGVQAFDASCRELDLSDCLYRFYRDTRFSKDKTPYKTHMGVYICPKGKKSMWAGYYFHIEPESDYLGSHMLCCGAYMPDNEMLKVLREDIFTNGEEYVKAVKQAKHFTLCSEPSLKKLPKEFAESPYGEYNKLKAHLLQLDVNTQFLMQDNLAQNVVKEFKTCRNYVAYLNRAFSFTGNY